MKSAIFIVCAVAAAVGFLLLPWLVFFKAPLAYELYVNQKIFYYHVPATFVMFTSIFVCGVASIGFLSTRKPAWDDVASAAGELTVAFGAIMMTTGPIWGKAAWGQWWVWDARLTSSMILWMTFIAFSLVRRFGGPGSERLGAGLAIFGMVNVPLIYFAVNFWRTQHPTNKVVPRLDGEMRTAFLVAILSYFTLYYVLLTTRIAVGRGQRTLHAVEDLAVETGHLE